MFCKVGKIKLFILEIMHDLFFLLVNFQCNIVVDGNFQIPFKKVIHFSPPLYRQRYNFVKDLVDQHKPKKVGISSSKRLTLL